VWYTWEGPGTRYFDNDETHMFYASSPPILWSIEKYTKDKLELLRKDGFKGAAKLHFGFKNTMVSVSIAL